MRTVVGKCSFCYLGATKHKVVCYHTKSCRVVHLHCGTPRLRSLTAFAAPSKSQQNQKTKKTKHAKNSGVELVGAYSALRVCACRHGLHGTTLPAFVPSQLLPLITRPSAAMKLGLSCPRPHNWTGFLRNPMAQTHAVSRGPAAWDD